jgi:hypothetical protein
MIMRSTTHRAIAAAAAVGLALSVGLTSTTASAARRHVGNGAAAFGAFAVMAGTIAAIAAANNGPYYGYGTYYGSPYGYGSYYGPAYYAPGPYYGSYAYRPAWRGHVSHYRRHR